MARSVNLDALQEMARIKTIEVMERFDGFTDGTRVLMLLVREKDGASHNEYQRRCITEVTHTSEQFARHLEKMIYFSICSNEPYRVYATLNSRNLRKAEHVLKTNMLSVDFADDENRSFFYERFEYRWHSALMQDASRKTKFFLLDVDDGIHDWNAVENACWDAQIEIVLKYRTKNGWHFITKPFNPALLTVPCDLKKDSQMLLFWK